MNQDQYHELRARGVTSGTLRVNDLSHAGPRTLLYGCDAAQDFVHVYLADDGLFHIVTYSPEGQLIKEQRGEAVCAYAVVPQAVYPHKSDWEFCQLLQARGRHIPYASFVETPECQWYGLRREELTARPAPAPKAPPLTMGHPH
jgi:hypothetical protein